MNGENEMIGCDSVTVKEGEKGFYLECDVKDTGQSASWLKDGNDLRPELQKIVEGTIHKLKIPEFVIDDSGTYTVCINNKQRQIKIEVEGKIFFNSRSIFSQNVLKQFGIPFHANLRLLCCISFLYFCETCF